MNIFFDLDGTLIDAKERLYQLFQHLVPESKLSFEEYWDLKKSKISHKEILESKFSFSNEEIALFEKKWLDAIELPGWLALDKPFDGVTEYLKELKKNYTLYLITARQSESRALQQVAQFGWDGIFEKVLVTTQKSEKYDAIKNSVVTKEEDWIIGDTGKEVETGKKLNIRTAAVLSGFRNKKVLESYHPDLIVNKVTDISAEHYGK